MRGARGPATALHAHCELKSEGAREGLIHAAEKRRFKGAGAEACRDEGARAAGRRVAPAPRRRRPPLRLRGERRRHRRTQQSEVELTNNERDTTAARYPALRSRRGAFYGAIHRGVYGIDEQRCMPRAAIAIAHANESNVVHCEGPVDVPPRRVAARVAARVEAHERRRRAAPRPAEMLGGASEIVSQIRMK